jgi:hypothetical protein
MGDDDRRLVTGDLGFLRSPKIPNTNVFNGMMNPEILNSEVGAHNVYNRGLFMTVTMRVCYL